MATPPSIIYERDPNCAPSPSMYGYIEKGSLTEIDLISKFLMTGTAISASASEEHMRTYVKLPDMRTKEEDEYRQDIRFFGIQSLITRMSEEIKTAGIASSLKTTGTRRQFIKSQGYVKCNQMPIKEFMVAFDRVLEILCNPVVNTMQKLPDVESLLPLGGIVDSNTIMNNPFVMMKFMNLMGQGGETSNLSNEIFNKMLMSQFMGQNGFNAQADFGEGSDMSSMTPEQIMLMSMMMNNQ
jgi:hypothetical protein